MSDSDQSPHLQEEPQEERGAPGSRDEGSPLSEGGPANRPAGDPHEGDSTGVDEQDTALPEMEEMPAGDQGG
jgi:hypothetical protein